MVISSLVVLALAENYYKNEAEKSLDKAQAVLKTANDQLVTGHVGQVFYVADGDKCKPVKIQFDGYKFLVFSNDSAMALMKDRHGYYATQADGIEVRCYQIDKVLH